MSRPPLANRYQQNTVKSGFALKGVYVARFLVGLLLALNVVLILTILYSSNGLPGYKKQNLQVKDLEEKLFKLKVENQKLFEIIQALKTSPKAQEKLVRRELGWVRENEIVFESADRENEDVEKGAVPIKPFNFPK
jgi:cell division protein FtsB